MNSTRIIVQGLLLIGLGLGAGSANAQDGPSEEHPFVFALESWPAPEEPKGGVVPESAFFDAEPGDRRMDGRSEAGDRGIALESALGFDGKEAETVAGVHAAAEGGCRVAELVL